MKEKAGDVLMGEEEEHQQRGDSYSDVDREKVKIQEQAEGSDCNN